MMTSAEDQLAVAIENQLAAIETLFGPTSTRDLSVRIRQVAINTVLSLDSTDDREAAGAAGDVMCLLWPRAAPELSGQAEWWATPLGRLVARAGDHPSSEAVTHSVAAAMLGITRGAIPSLISTGSLDRHPDGGVLIASVLQRLAR